MQAQANRKLARHIRASKNLDARIRKSQRADGTWVFEVRRELYDPTTGKASRNYETCGTRIDKAKARLAEVTTSESRGEQVSTLTMTVQEAHAIRERLPNRQRTKDGEDADWRLYIGPRWGKTKVRDIRKNDVLAWITRLQRQDGKSEFAGGTKVRILNAFSVILNVAIEEGALTVNPVKQLGRGKPKHGQSRKRIISTDEEARLLAYMAPYPWAAEIVEVALDQALRLGEVLALQHENVDFVNGKLHVRHQLREDGTLGPPKTVSDDDYAAGYVASIDLRPRAREILLAKREEASTGHVFRNSLDKPRQRRDVQRAFNKARDNAALQVTRDGKVVFHSLRHTRISRLANNREIPLPHVQAFARHSKLETTLEYVHKVEDVKTTEAILTSA